MRTTVDLDPKVLRELRLEAARRGTTVKTLLNALLRAGLSSRVSEPRTAYRVKAVSMGLPRVDLEKALRLADALEDEDRLATLKRTS